MRRGKDNFCVRIFKKVMHKMYPPVPKIAWTTQGKWLRTMVGFFCIMHVIFFVVALAITGFGPMMASMFLSIWSYSCYLTLREWTVILYILFVAGISVLMVYDELFDDKVDFGKQFNHTQPLGYFI